MKPIQYLTVACTRCKKKHRVAPHLLGRMAKCKRCKKRFELKPLEADPDKVPESETEEQAFYIPVSLTNNPMVDQEYQKQSRAQTNFVKQVDQSESKFKPFIVFGGVFFVLASLVFLLIMLVK